ncbi:MAG: lipoate--protein ligase [Spirochaetaceae bacterium]|nr:MAG: lipoate--protein ligase [Spirochaetaceae bacterium]
MQRAPRVLISEITDPRFNLATEDWIFREMAAHTHVLLLWRNSRCVVIGRHQNPWVECDLELMRAEGVPAARRQSGGGAVYHDPGNTNFTFLSPTPEYSRDRNFGIVLRALRTLGIEAFRSGRNDILVSTGGEDRKISGNAFKHTRERSFHHGTLLVEADLDRLGRYLTPASQRLEARGTRSVPSPVVNLREIDPRLSHERICRALSEAFLEEFAAPEPRDPPEYLDGEVLTAIPSLREYYEKMRAWEWIYGMTPEFVHSFSPDPAITLDIRVREGVIVAVVVHSVQPEEDGLGRLLERGLSGLRYDGATIAAALPGSVPARIRTGIAEEIGGIP